MQHVARVKLKMIETSICSIINTKLSTPIFGPPMNKHRTFHDLKGAIS